MWAAHFLRRLKTASKRRSRYALLAPSFVIVIEHAPNDDHRRRVGAEARALATKTMRPGPATFTCAEMVALTTHSAHEGEDRNETPDATPSQPHPRDRH